MKLLLVDDHPLFLDGLNDLLTAHGLDVVGTARDGIDAIEKARTLHPEVIVMDIRMPRLDGLAAMRQITAELPSSKVVMLTTSSDSDDLFDAIRSGASGYLLKTESGHELLNLLEELMRGEMALSPGLAARILCEFGRHASAATPSASLSTREREVLALVAQGLKYKEVAARLFLSERTVKFHMGQIVRRLQLKNRMEVIDYARRTGLVP